LSKNQKCEKCVDTLPACTCSITIEAHHQPAHAASPSYGCSPFKNFITQCVGVIETDLELPHVRPLASRHHLRHHLRRHRVGISIGIYAINFATVASASASASASAWYDELMHHTSTPSPAPFSSDYNIDTLHVIGLRNEFLRNFVYNSHHHQRSPATLDPEQPVSLGGRLINLCVQRSW